MPNDNEYSPDWVSHPGESLADVLQERSMTPQQLAAQMQVSESLVNFVLRGKEPITEEFSNKLFAVLKTSAHFWLERQRRYDKDKARLKYEGSCHQ